MLVWRRFARAPLSFLGDGRGGRKQSAAFLGSRARRWSESFGALPPPKAPSHAAKSGSETQYRISVDPRMLPTCFSTRIGIGTTFHRAARFFRGGGGGETEQPGRRRRRRPGRFRACCFSGRATLHATSTRSASSHTATATTIATHHQTTIAIIRARPTKQGVPPRGIQPLAPPPNWTRDDDESPFPCSPEAPRPIAREQHRVVPVASSRARAPASRVAGLQARVV
jgi:hypothetical protein